MQVQELLLASADNLNLPHIPGTAICGSFDFIETAPSGAYVCGWVFDRRDSTAPCEIVVHVGGAVIGRGVANHSRQDVEAAGAPHDLVGFRIPVGSAKANQRLQIYILSLGETFLLHEFSLTKPLPECSLTRNDVISVFRMLFGRDPENEDTIKHQLSVHSNRSSLFKALFNSPEFHENNMDLIAMVHQMNSGE